MPVFHSQRIIHVHNPRCGGTSINAVLWRNEQPQLGALKVRVVNYHYVYGIHRLGENDVWELDHLDWADLRAVVSPWAWEAYRRCVVVRDPWARFVSEYRRKHGRNDHRLLRGDLDFTAYCTEFLRRVDGIDPRAGGRIGRHHFADCHFLPQWRYAGASAAAVDPDLYVLRLESIADDWQRFVAAFDGDPAAYQLPRMNAVAPATVATEPGVDAALGRRIERFYADDYRLFGYTPRFG